MSVGHTMTQQHIHNHHIHSSPLQVVPQFAALAVVRSAVADKATTHNFTPSQ
jgi:hypothetical protein